MRALPSQAKYNQPLIPFSAYLLVVCARWAQTEGITELRRLRICLHCVPCGAAANGINFLLMIISPMNE